MTTTLDFAAFDVDNHYYEALDAFTRHLEPGYERRTMQWAEVGGKTRLLVGGKINRFIPNPTFDPVSRPGALDEYFRGRNPKQAGVADLFGELEPIDPSYRDRDARLARMDEQGLAGAFFFPTLAVGMEQPLMGDPAALMAAFRAFNRWLDEDWGFAYRDRIFAAPYIPLVDVDNAVAELEWALERDARIVMIGVGPVVTAAGGLAPSHPTYDPFWARLDEAGITLGLHGGDSAYGRYLKHWGQSAELEAFRTNPLRSLLSHDPIHDTVAAMLADQLFVRFPNLRVASIELGSSWVFHLFEKLAKAYGQAPYAFPEDPRETFRRHVWVSPFYEDDLAGLKDLVGVERILMGSDWPHAEGLAEPVTYIDDLRRHGYTDAEARLVMRDNGLALSRAAAPAPA